MKKYFILICKSSTGAIYPSSVMCTVEDLQRAFANFTELGVNVIDIKDFNFNPADYE